MPVSSAKKTTKSTSQKSSSGSKTKSSPAKAASKATNAAASSAEAANRATQNVADHAAKSAYDAAESTQRAAQNVVNISGNAAREMLSSSTEEAQRAQEKAFTIGREGVENFSRACNMYTNMLTEFANIARGNFEAVMESCNVTATICKEVGEELTDSCNRNFSESLEISKEAFNCRTINDMVELQNRALRQYMDTCFNEGNRFTNIAYEGAAEAMEPINDRVSTASEQLSKALAA